jgi:hemerythrin-like domain-containing protein
MMEHRLIEKVIPIIRTATATARREGRIDTALVDFLVDFIRTYADRCHHGKEEDILFRDLERKPLAPEHRAVMDELIAEHREGRRMVGELRAAAAAYKAGDEGALGNVVDRLEALAAFYPAHIWKEDKVFFLPSMEYLSPEEREAMLAEEREFDREFLHKMFQERMAATAAAAAEHSIVNGGEASNGVGPQQCEINQ